MTLTFELELDSTPRISFDQRSFS